MASNHMPQALFSWTPMKDCRLGSYEKEQLFEKPLTPSDVGKLNRLVIPKQHAEKYFPLDSDSGEKGLILSFEDEVGKAWSFRYSYWTSSQSYVLTKGWSRYVKEKRLDAGDIVLFERQLSNTDRLYIGWKRKGGQVTVGTHSHRSLQWSPLAYGAPPAAAQTSQFMAPPAANSKKLRLFGVNMECGELAPNSSTSSSSHDHHQHHQQFAPQRELQLLPTYYSDLDSQM